MRFCKVAVSLMAMLMVVSANAAVTSQTYVDGVMAEKEDVSNKKTDTYTSGSTTEYPSIKVAEDIAKKATEGKQDKLPAQAENSGKFLTTNGSELSWGTVETGDKLPEQAGNSGKFLTTDGENTSWSDKVLTNTATGDGSFSTGGATAVTEQYGTALGSQAVASGGGTALGWTASASGQTATALGAGASATNNASMAVGPAASAGAAGAAAVGWNTNAAGENSVALGTSAATGSSATGSVQLGDGTNNTANTLQFRDYQLVGADGKIPVERLPDDIGGLPDQSGNSGKFLTTDGSTASWSDKVLTNTATADDSVVVSGAVATSAAKSVVIGAGANLVASGAQGVAIGANARVAQAASVAVGFGARAPNAPQATAVGYGSSASGQHSVALGEGAMTGSSASFAVQLGNGTNDTSGTLQFRDYQLVGANGKIPAERIPTAFVPVGSSSSPTSYATMWIE